MRSLIIFLIILLLSSFVLSNSFIVDIFTKDDFVRRTGKDPSEFGIDLKSNSVLFISIDSKKYIAKYKKFFRFNSFEKLINVISNPIIIDLDTGSKVEDGEVLRYLKEYIFFGLYPFADNWYYNPKDNISCYWERDLERYDRYYEEVGKYALKQTKLLSYLNLTQDVLSFLLALSIGVGTGAGKILTVTGMTIDLATIGIDEAQLILLNNMIKEYKSEIGEVITKEGLEKTEELVVEDVGTLRDVFGTAGEIVGAGKIIMDVVEDVRAYETLRDITMIFGKEWLKEALEYGGKAGFITKKVKEAKEILKGNALEWVASLLKTESSRARRDGIRIVLDCLMMKNLAGMMRRDLEEMKKGEGIDLEVLERFMKNAIEVRLIEIDLIRLIKGYGEPEKLSPIHRALDAVVKLAGGQKQEDMEEKLDELIGMIKVELNRLIEVVKVEERKTKEEGGDKEKRRGENEPNIQSYLFIMEFSSEYFTGINTNALEENGYDYEINGNTVKWISTVTYGEGDIRHICDTIIESATAAVIYDTGTKKFRIGIASMDSLKMLLTLYGDMDPANVSRLFTNYIFAVIGKAINDGVIQIQDKDLWNTYSGWWKGTYLPSFQEIKIMNNTGYDLTIISSYLYGNELWFLPGNTEAERKWLLPLAHRWSPFDEVDYTGRVRENGDASIEFDLSINNAVEIFTTAMAVNDNGENSKVSINDETFVEKQNCCSYLKQSYLNNGNYTLELFGHKTWSHISPRIGILVIGGNIVNTSAAISPDEYGDPHPMIIRIPQGETIIENQEENI